MNIAEYALRPFLQPLAFFRWKFVRTNDSAWERREPCDRARCRGTRLREEMRVILAQSIAQNADELVVAIDKAFAVDLERFVFSARSSARRCGTSVPCSLIARRDYLTVRGAQNRP